MEILFYDVATPHPYTNETFLQGGLGGTEATIVRVAHQLKKKHTIYIAQHCRKTEDNQIGDGVHYCSLETANALSPDVVVLLRKCKWLEKVGKQFPKAKRYFWLHDNPSRSLYAAPEMLQKYRYTLIAVSHFHQQAIQKRLKGRWYHKIRNFVRGFKDAPVKVIYNPIDDALIPNNTPWNPNQLFLASTPHKGLAMTLELFTHLRKYYPEYRLLIATYAEWDKNIALPDNVEFLGSLAHAEVIQKMRESFCVFYPQYKGNETFGLVYAESNAVGTPVLAHDFGSAKEVLSDAGQLVDGRNPATIIEKISQWRKQRPQLEAKVDFRLSRVGEAWEDLLKTNLFNVGPQ